MSSPADKCRQLATDVEKRRKIGAMRPIHVSAKQHQEYADLKPRAQQLDALAPDMARLLADTLDALAKHRSWMRCERATTVTSDEADALLAEADRLTQEPA